MQSLRRVYTSSALILLNSLLLFLVLNLALYVATTIGHPRYGPLTRYATSLVMRAYPGWSDSDVDLLMRETYLDARPEYDVISQLRERPTSGRFVNVSPAGFRLVAHQGPWPPAREATNIYVFGGSTTFGYGGKDSDTIPSQLQDLIDGEPRKPVHIYNFGRAAYTSTQELVALFSLIREGQPPDIAIFIDGLNDCTNWRDNSWLYGRILKARISESLWQSIVNDATMLPLVQYIRKTVLGLQHSGEVHQDAPTAVMINSVLTNWRTNHDEIIRLCRPYGTKTVFVWQPTPFYKYSLGYHFLGDQAKYNYNYLPVVAVYPEIERSAAAGVLGPDFLFLGDIQEHEQRNLYVDAAHYNPAGCHDIADRIYRFLLKSSLI